MPQAACCSQVYLSSGEWSAHPPALLLEEEGGSGITVPLLHLPHDRRQYPFIHPWSHCAPRPAPPRQRDGTRRYRGSHSVTQGHTALQRVTPCAILPRTAVHPPVLVGCRLGKRFPSVSSSNFLHPYFLGFPCLLKKRGNCEAYLERVSTARKECYSGHFHFL